MTAVCKCTRFYDTLRYMKSDNDARLCEAFESELLVNLRSVCGDFATVGSSCEVGVAVSGGADSVSLLFGLYRKLPFRSLRVLTINHNLRPVEETCGDADFVEALCRRLGVAWERVDIPRGDILSYADSHGIGMEEAARFFRYSVFNDFIQKNKLAVLCLAHNADDQVETLVMRFLRGGGTAALSGIPMKRDRFVRPLLTINRSLIEAYLEALGETYRTDLSNSDTSIERNAVRNQLLPQIDSLYPGWRKAAVSLSEKMRDDEAYFIEEAECALSRVCYTFESGLAALDFGLFSKEPNALKVRILYKVCDDVGASGRFPYVQIRKILQLTSDVQNTKWQVHACGVSFHRCGGKILCQKTQNEATETGFTVILERDGMYELPGMLVSAVRQGTSLVLKDCAAGNAICLRQVCYPIMARSAWTGDCVETAKRATKSVAAILESWKCAEKRNRVVIIQRLDVPSQEIVALWGVPFGLKNWVVLPACE